MLPATLTAAAALGVLCLALARFWPQHVDARAAAIPLLGVLFALPALTRAGAHTVALDAHVRHLAAVRTDPYLAWDPPGESLAGQLRNHSALLDLSAWAVARALGNAAGLALVAVVALGLALTLVYALARALGLGAGASLAAQALAISLPTTATRLVQGPYSALLAEALGLLLLVHLVRRFLYLDGARDAGAAFLFLVLAQAVSPLSLLSVTAVVLVLVLWELAAGDRRRALRLFTAVAFSTPLAGLVHLRVLPRLWGDGLAGTSGSNGLVPLYHVVYPMLVVPGVVALRAAPDHGRRLIVAALGVGAALLAVGPRVLADAAAAEPLASTVAVAAAAGLSWLWQRGRTGRCAATVAALYAAGWGLVRAAEVYNLAR